MYDGKLLVVVVRDLNHQYYPLAFEVIEMERKERWSWLLPLLIEDIDEDRK